MQARCIIKVQCRLCASNRASAQQLLEQLMAAGTLHMYTVPITCISIVYCVGAAVVQQLLEQILAAGASFDVQLIWWQACWLTCLSVSLCSEALVMCYFIDILIAVKTVLLVSSSGLVGWVSRTRGRGGTLPAAVGLT